MTRRLARAASLALSVLLAANGCARDNSMSMYVVSNGAGKNQVVLGQSAQLCYRGPAGSVGIVNRGIGPIEPGKCVRVRPSKTTVYTIRAAAPAQDARNISQTVVVVLPPTQARVSLDGATPNSYAGRCPTSVAFSGHVGLNGHGSNVVYEFVWSGGAGAKRTANVAADGIAAVHEVLTFKRSTKGWGEIRVDAPNSATSSRANFAVQCLIEIASQRIWALAQISRCKPGSGYPGNGCARTVNKVVAEAIGHTVPPDAPPFDCGGANWNPTGVHRCSTAWVPDVVQMIVEHGAGRQLARSETLPGDIAVQDGSNASRGMNHIGFCEDAGCTTVLSNRSSTGQLCGITNATMSNNGYPYPPDYPPTFYRIGG